jgi:isopentenyl diphosphate isomerase/L-lactate dehydrogenase-like FMN-dependent dehydrogenase
VLPSIVDAVGSKASVLVDGGFRRGHDIVRALILGARGVLVTRPVMWGLAAYGAEGVPSVLEMLQSDLARQMGALGASNLAALSRALIKIHAKGATAKTSSALNPAQSDLRYSTRSAFCAAVRFNPNNRS